MKQLQIVACVTNELRYWWETAVYLHNLTSLGYQNINILIFVKQNETPLPKWKELQIKFPEVNFQIFVDRKIAAIGNAFNYKPLYRLWMLQEWFKLRPELEQDAILYTDTDIILTKYLDFTSFLQDDINYLSWTGNKERTDNYIGQPYFDSKESQVEPSKLATFKKIDVLAKMGESTKTTRQIITENLPNTGGAQYLLKNINSQFWTDCFNACCEIKLFLAGLNQTFMKGSTPTEKENNGWQSFCSDMVSILYTLWGHNKETRCPVELDFAWSTDRLSRVKEVFIIHNAGIVQEYNQKVAFEKEYVDTKLFFKGKYQTYTPFEDLDVLNEIITNPVSAQFANAVYVEWILKTHKFLNQ